MLEKVIFVGGTSFSGSTMLDMILANDPGGFSCGEVVGLFAPLKPHHFNPWCGCGDANCAVWPEVRRAGPRGMYSKIEEMFPHVSFVVDSSKNPCWIAQQEKIARSMGLDVRHVLIWKSPEGLAKSFSKRGRPGKFESAYVNYHRRYNARGRDWIGVQYERLVEDPAVLAGLCAHLGIPMFDGKQEFWTSTHHTLFGNNSAKVSLLSPEHPRFHAIRSKLGQFEGDSPVSVVHHRSIFRNGSNHGVERHAPEGIRWERLERVHEALRMRSISASGRVGDADSRRVEFPMVGAIEVGLHRLLFGARRFLGPMRLWRFRRS